MIVINTKIVKTNTCFWLFIEVFINIIILFVIDIIFDWANILVFLTFLNSNNITIND